MYNINANPTAEERVARLIREAAMNLGGHYTRLDVVTEGFSKSVDQFEGVGRDYIISLIYSMNETVMILHTLGAKDVADAVGFGFLDGRDWYDETLKLVHEGITEDETLKQHLDEFSARCDRLRPPRKNPELEDELGDDDEGELAAIAGQTH